MTYPGATTFPGAFTFPGGPVYAPTSPYLGASYATLGAVTFGYTEASGVMWGLEDIQGWGGSPASTIQVTQKPRSDGGWAGPSWLSSRTITVTGWVYAPTTALLTDAVDRLDAAVSLAATPLTVVEAGRSRWMNVRRAGEVLAAYVNDTQATWSIQLVATDPRKFGAATTQTTGLPSVTGGLTYPITYPITYSAVQVTGVVSATNPGTANGKLALRVHGPCTGPSITHLGTGAALTFASSLVINSGDWLDIDMENRTVLANGQARRNNTVTSRGWFGFDPGVNQYAFNAYTYNAGSSLDVTTTPAWQ